MKNAYFSVPECPISLALLSDSHNINSMSILGSLGAHKPDAICIAGDIINYEKQPIEETFFLEKQKNVLPLLKGCTSIASTFLSLGNHEWLIHPDEINMIKSAGVVVLDNSWIRFKDVLIAGLTSPHVTAYQRFREKQNAMHHYPSAAVGKDYPRPEVPELDWLQLLEQEEGYKIVLSHHPEHYRYLEGRKIDLILSGHAHGGQWRVANHGIYAPSQGWLPQYTSGMYGKMIVSRGLSNPTIIPRINNPTEIVYVNIVNQQIKEKKTTEGE